MKTLGSVTVFIKMTEIYWNQWINQRQNEILLYMTFALVHECLGKNVYLVSIFFFLSQAYYLPC